MQLLLSLILKVTLLTYVKLTLASENGIDENGQIDIERLYRYKTTTLRFDCIDSRERGLKVK